MLYLTVLAVFLLCACRYCAALSVSQGIRNSQSTIDALKQKVSQSLGQAASQAPYDNDVFYYRFCMEADPQSSMDKHLEWRQSAQGQMIASAAHDAVAKATSGGGWDNEPVVAAAPSGPIINQYLTPEKCRTTTNDSTGDLCYCIRAGQIDDNGLMSALAKSDDLVDFFVYVKHVQSIVANKRSLDSDKLIQVITCNDLSGIKLIGGGGDGAKQFRQALGASSKITSELYPQTAGPTLLLNLPTLLQALVNLFTPLFPPSVKARLQFARGVINSEWKLSEVATPNGIHRAEFLAELNKVLDKTKK